MPVLSVAAFILAACSSSETPPGATPTNAARESSHPIVKSKPDIVAAGTGVAIGSGWYAYESFHNQNFRWVDDMAKFMVAKGDGGTKPVSFDVEAGPGIGSTTFALHVLDASGANVASANVVGHERVTFNVPVRPNGAVTYELHADGGGKPSPNEKRILNFRVFTIDSKPSAVVAAADIVAQGDVELGKNWGVLEHYAGQTFRWVANDAEIEVDAPAAGPKTLLVDLAAGPAVLAPNDFALTLEAPPGSPAQTQHVKAIGSASFTLYLRKGANTFRLHVASTGLPSKGDKRVLSFRVFKLKVT